MSQSIRRSAAPRAVVIGAGPAGLMAAEALARAGVGVDVYDAMPSVGRKFLLAGIGGLNITHSEPFEDFVGRYGERAAFLRPMLTAFGPAALREWVQGLGIDTFVGTSGRVFPREMKAAPLLRAWLRRLRGAGVRIHVRHRWLGWDAEGGLMLHGPDGAFSLRPDATVLALGGASWPRLGSDGAWVETLAGQGVAVAPLKSANCGFETEWSAYLRDRHGGAVLKPVVMRVDDGDGGQLSRQGEMILSRYGVEGSLVYAFSRLLRDTIERDGRATFRLDLAPGHELARIVALLTGERGRRSLSSFLKSRLRLDAAKVALLHECAAPDVLADPHRLAEAIKALPVTVHATRPLAEAISTAGGLSLDELEAGLMIKALPGVFVAGEMLDWEAPTGGYLLTACFATGKAAGEAAARWLGR